jgi:hypothetical protein
MSAAARRAFGHARLCAMASRLLDREAALVLLAAREDTPCSTADLVAGFADEAAVLLRAYDEARALLLALVRRLEIENVKLAWRALARGIPPGRWSPLWRPFDRRRSLPPRTRPALPLTKEHATDASSLSEFVSRLRSTAYGEIAAAVLRSHGDDVPAAELALERWAFIRIAEEAERLPAGEADAAALALRVVRERDIDCLRRAVSRGFAPAVAPALTARLGRDAPADALEQIAAWQPGDGPLGARLPRTLVRNPERIPDWNALELALRRERRVACERALMGPPFRLASPVAFLLLREAEMAGRLAIDRARAVGGAMATTERALAAGRMGA